MESCFVEWLPVRDRAAIYTADDHGEASFRPVDASDSYFTVCIGRLTQHDMTGV